MEPIADILSAFTLQREGLQTENFPAVKLALEGIGLCNATLKKLKSWVDEHDFETIPEEIHFFKEVKSVPMSYLIYYTEMRTCELHQPKAGKQYKVAFLEKELKKINKFFYRNADFVHYMEMGNTYLDHLYFSRTQNPEYPVHPFTNYYQFPEFSTSHDMLWARVIALNKLIHYIRGELEHLKPRRALETLHKKHKVLIWTGSKTALTELIYALYSDEVLNHGAVDLKTITNGFEEFFNINLNQMYKTYAEIKERRGSRTKFLNELIINLEHKMNREDHR
ncbi:MAG: hypothetical protein CL868_19850 [Cytophagaceae bacterium]|nr:hypothetical protein [Cytophagaceae bacterium]|tara:strand:- start:3872 stop:4711 length:840 start_codon:yes stop_codon:yes gene_type:complete